MKLLQIHIEPVPIDIDAEGVARVGGTRVSIDTVIYAFQQGATAEEIAQQYPVLNLADIYSTITYYLRHKDEIDNYLKSRQGQTEQMRQEIETRFDSMGIRERLLARNKKAE